MYDTVLIPTDGSEEAEAAAEEGIRLAEEVGADLRILSVVNTEDSLVTMHTGGAGVLRKRLTERAEDAVSSLSEKSRERGFDPVTVVEEGVPSEVIVDHAEENADVIVMGTTGRGGAKRMLLGSVADRVVRTSTVPVLTVRRDGSY